MTPDPALLLALPTVPDADLDLMRSSYCRAGTDADLAAIETEIAKRQRGTDLRTAIERHDVEQMAIDSDGPQSEEFADSLERVRARLFVTIAAQEPTP